jgi:two-component system cell cycle sensor histidine kinase/response regulator CckA
VNVSQSAPQNRRSTDRISAAALSTPETERADAIDQLAGTLAHEFSNLLTAMDGRLELLLDRFPTAGAERQLLLDLKMSVDAAGRITRQLLAISGRQTTIAEPTDLNALIQDSSDILQQVAGGAAQVRLDLAGALPFVAVDPRLIRQVLFGLIAAARDALAGEGRITVATYVESDLLGPTVRLSVTDTRAWADRDIARMFEPAPSTGRQARGAGLALTAIRGTVRQLGGTITCERAVPAGLSFHIRFPLSAS